MGTIFGAIQAGTLTALDLSFNGGLLFRINSLGDAPVAANTNPQGFWIGTRTGPSAVSVYRNGNAIASSTTPSSGVPALSMYLCASNLDGVPNFFVGDQVSAFFIGGGLNAAQAGNLSSRINAFMTAVGANVY